MEFGKFAWHEVCHDSSRQLAENSPKSITVRSKQMGNELMTLDVKKIQHMLIFICVDNSG
jgi:hypothetical protein